MKQLFFLEMSDFILWIETVIAAPVLHKQNRNHILYYKRAIFFGLWVINVSTFSVFILLISILSFISGVTVCLSTEPSAASNLSTHLLCLWQQF